MLRYGTAGSFFLIVNDWARCMYGGMVWMREVARRARLGGGIEREAKKE